jgi:hypothetical protein
MRARRQRDLEHLARDRHFEIERREIGCGESGDVFIADVAAILAKMRGDVVGAGLHGEFCGAQGVGVAPAPRVPQRRDMVDVDAETDGSNASAALRLASVGGHRVPSASPDARSSSARRRRRL